MTIREILQQNESLCMDSPQDRETLALALIDYEERGLFSVFLYVKSLSNIFFLLSELRAKTFCPCQCGEYIPDCTRY